MLLKKLIMDILKTLRKPYLSIFLSGLILFVSCERYNETNKQVQNIIDYSIFEHFKNSESFDNIINILNTKRLIKKSSKAEVNFEILKIVNSTMGTDIDLPKEFLNLSTVMKASDIFNIGLENNWINNDDIVISKEFAIDIQNNGFSKAITNYENKILGLNMSEVGFSKKVFFLNLMKTINHEIPSIFKSELFYKSQGPWRCLLALIAMVVTFVGLTSCVAIWPCLLSYTMFINASLAVADNC